MHDDFGHHACKKETEEACGELEVRPVVSVF